MDVDVPLGAWELTHFRVLRLNIHFFKVHLPVSRYRFFLFELQAPEQWDLRKKYAHLFWKLKIVQKVILEIVRTTQSV